MIHHILRGESFGITASEQLVEVGTRILYHIETAQKQPEVGYAERTFEGVHGIGVEILPYCLIAEKETGLAVIYEMMDIVGLEIVKNRHHHCPVSKDRKKSHRPLRRILSAQCNFVAFAYSSLLVKDMKFGYFAGYVAVLQR